MFSYFTIILTCSTCHWLCTEGTRSSFSIFALLTTKTYINWSFYHAMLSKCSISCNNSESIHLSVSTATCPFSGYFWHLRYHTTIHSSL